MTDHFIRKTGSDSNNGLSAGAAWLTIGKALLAGGLSSGDTAYVGAGIYREAITVGITPTGTTSIIGDVDGSKTGDAGEVRWTAYTTNDTTVANAVAACKLNGKNFLSFGNLHLVGGNPATGSCIDGQSVAGSHDLTFTKCAFTPGSNSGARLIGLTATVDLAANYAFDSCWFGPTGNAGSVFITAPTSTVADYNLASTFKNCTWVGGPNEGGPNLASSGANSFKGGGVTLENCTLFCATVTVNGSLSVAYPLLLSNCVIHSMDSGASPVTASAIGQIVEDYNVIWSPSARVKTGNGPFSQATFNYSTLFSYGQEVIWGGQLRPFGTPLAGSPMLGFGNAALASGRAATCTDDATVGTIAWTTPANASVPDGTLTTATALPAVTGVSHYLNAQGFSGFAGIPSNATIKSIRVEVLVTASAISSVAASSVKLLKAGAIVGNDLASSNTAQFPVTLSLPPSWGNTTDPLWGTTWTVAQVQAAGFGCVFSAKNTHATLTRDCTIDFIRVIVAYTLVDGSGGVAVDILGAPRPAGGNSTAYAVGALERGNTATVQAGTVHTSGSAWQVAGPGYEEFRTNVDAASATLALWALYDTAGQQPTVTILAAPELGLNSDTVLTWSDPGSNVWGQFTATIVPTSAGVIIVRLRAGATATSNAYFDDITLV